jgi:20S proteasome alpha/beta subunit
MSAIAIPQQRQFNPYAENGGTILAIAGADFTVIAGDTRQSDGYNIQTRYAPKVFRLSVLNCAITLFCSSLKHLFVGLTALCSP